MDIALADLESLAALYGLRVAFALLILLAGRYGARAARTLAQRLMRRAEADPTVVSFVGNIVFAAVWTFVLIAAIAQLGVQTASLIALLGAAGLAVGLALQGSLSNFAAGVLLALFRHFRVGDFIEAGGTMGTVEDIHIFTTTLRRPDGVKEVVPNGAVLGGNIINYSDLQRRRANIVIGVDYATDLARARTVLLEVVNADPRTLQDPAPMAIVDGFGDSAINLALRAWAVKDEFWPWYWDTLEAIKRRFDAEGISIPFPQRDVHLYMERPQAPPAGG
jgi:small conductance mechanosensitive channel